jgi:hypothetical protein
MALARKGKTGTGTRKPSKAKLVTKVIRKIEKKLEADELKPTVGDFIRLLQLEKELEDEQPREIKVSWVEPDEKGPASQEG